MDPFFETIPFFTTEHRALAARVAEIAEREIEMRAADDEDDADTALRNYILLLAENDLLRYAVGSPGQPFDLRSFCLIRETLAYSSSLADLAFVMQGLGTYAISLSADEHVRDFWLARARKGQAIAAFALTEPDAGSDVAGLKTTARREDDTYIIDGRKRFISNAGVADFYTVFARTGTRDDGRAEISAFIVSARMPGFSVAERTKMIAPHPIGELEKLADMATEFEAARLLVYRAAYLRDTEVQPSTREASEAKLFATEAAGRIIDQAVQIHGGTGLLRGTVVERLYRDVRALRIYERTSEIQKLVIANQLLKE